MASQKKATPSSLYELLKEAAVDGEDITLSGPEAADLLEVIETGVEVYLYEGTKEFWGKFRHHLQIIKCFKDISR